MTSAPSDPSRPAPRVSVVMSVHNDAPYLRDAVDSILGQTVADLEFVIVDDGSTDGSSEILRDYAARDPRIWLIARENRGLPASLNEGIAVARAPYIARMDADDVSYPDRLERQLAHLDAHPEIAVLGGFVRFIDEASRPFIDTRLPTGHAEIDRCNLVGRTAIIHPTVVMRRDAVLDVGGYDESYTNSQDTDLWLRMGERVRLANYDGLVLDYRFHGASDSGRNIELQARMNERACVAAQARRGGPPPPREYKQWRPGSDRASRRDYALKWAWQARKFGYGDTARHYFLKALRIDPFSAKSWRGLAFGVLRRRRG